MRQWMVFVVSLVCAYSSYGNELPGTLLKGHGARVTAVAISPSGDHLASSDYTTSEIWIWSMTDKKVISKIPFPKKADVSVIAFSPNGKLLAASSYEAFGLWDVRTTRNICQILPEAESIYGFSWAPDSGILAIAIDNRIRLVSASNGKVTKEHAHPKDHTMHALAFGSAMAKLVHWNRETHDFGSLLDIISGVKKAEFVGGHESPVRSSCYIDTQSIIASAGHDGRIVLWSSVTGEKIAAYQIDDSSIVGISYSKKEDVLIAATEKGAIWRCRLATKVARVLRYRTPVSCMAMSLDGRLVALGYGDDGIGAREPVNRGLLVVSDIQTVAKGQR